MPNNFSMVDVALGLVVVYLVLSLICSSVSEGIETFVKSRSRQLERGIREILADPEGTGITHLVYNHPLITGLFQGEYKPGDLRPGKILKGNFYSKTNLPSYIPATTFALVILDLILPATDATPSGVGATLHPSGSVSHELALRLRAAAAAFPSPAVARTIPLLIDASAHDLVKVREGIEKMFDSTMDRVSGWYKRRTQIILFSIALAVSAGLNIDTVAIANHLASDPSARSYIVNAAQAYTTADLANAVGSRPGDPQANPGGASSTASADPAKKPANLEKVFEYATELQKFGVPIGWRGGEKLENSRQWFLKVAGILASALAAALGAPFWFDILNRFVVVRSTIKPREKSHEEGSKD